jgi:hypothetical protein
MVRRLTIVAILLFSAAAFGDWGPQPGLIAGRSIWGENEIFLAGGMLNVPTSNYCSFSIGIECMAWERFIFNDGYLVETLSSRTLIIPIYRKWYIPITDELNPCVFAGIVAQFGSVDCLGNLWNNFSISAGAGMDFKIGNTIPFIEIFPLYNPYMIPNWGAQFDIGIRFKT